MKKIFFLFLLICVLQGARAQSRHWVILQDTSVARGNHWAKVGVDIFNDTTMFLPMGGGSVCVYGSGVIVVDSCDTITLPRWQTGTSGVSSNYLGVDSLPSSGNRNTALGDLTNILGGDDNTGMGFQALQNNNGNRNTVVGSESFSQLSGSENAVLGFSALDNASANKNTAIGSISFNNLVGGDSNTAIGWGSGNGGSGGGVTGNDNTFLGANAIFKIGATTAHYRTALGADAIAEKDSTMQLGSATATKMVNTNGVYATEAGLNDSGATAPFILNSNAGTPGKFLESQGPGVTPVWDSITIPALCLVAGTGNVTIGTGPSCDTISVACCTDTGLQAGAGIKINYGAVRDTISSTITQGVTSIVGTAPITVGTNGTIDTIHANLVAGAGISITTSATADTIKATGSGLTAVYPYNASSNPITIISSDSIALIRWSIAGSHNEYLGLGAGHSNTVGIYNTTVGDSADFSDTAGSHIIAIGLDALYNHKGLSTHLSDSIIAIGEKSLFSNTIGGDDIAIGINAMYANTAGAHNICIGMSADSGVLTRDDVVVIGDHAAYGADKMNIVAIGYRAMFSGGSVGVTDPKCVAVGYLSQQFNTLGNTGIDNTSVGWQALEGVSGNGTGQDNTAVGYDALWQSNTSNSEFNTAVGSQALSGLTTGAENTSVGNAALATLTTGVFCTTVGYGSDVNATGAKNRTAIGSNAVCTADSTIQLGDTHVQMVNTSAGITEGGKLVLKSVTTAISYGFDASGTDYCVIESGNGTTVTLPATATLGRHCEIVFANTTAANTMTVSGNTHNINGVASVTLNAAVAAFTAQNSITVVGDGTNWWIVGSN